MIKLDRIISKKTYFIALIFFLILTAVLIIIKKKSFNDAETTDENIAMSAMEPIIVKAETYSRATFFHSMPVIGSIEIPSSWEGKYRLDDKENRVAKFQYIGNPDLTADIFRINVYPESDYKEKDKEKKIEVSGGYVFSYRVQPDNPYTGEDRENFLHMVNKVESLISSFRPISVR